MLDHNDETDSTPARPLTAPREGVPDVIVGESQLEATIEMLAAGSGPVAIDAERASGFKYSGRAYLIQLRRTGSGTSLIDPIKFASLANVDRVLSDTEWILHAAGQDLPCLAEVGMHPRRLFDTELAARLCGFERVSLAALTERLLGYSLQKQHSAADWSTRPLPQDWLNYAALDVELLIDLRDILDEELTRQGKREWAAEEFDALIFSPPPKPRKEPWRRTSGIHRVKGQPGLARVRQLWYARDNIAQALDKSPSKIIPDAAITDAAIADPGTNSELMKIPGFQRRHGRSNVNIWLEALAEARELHHNELPTLAPHTDGPPAPHRWASRDPEAATRLKRVRASVVAMAEEVSMPAENLIPPSAVRAVAWQPPSQIETQAVQEALRASGARQWQVRLTADKIAQALRD